MHGPVSFSKVMISTKPYMMRAIYEWCADQGFTPYMQVVVDVRTRVPQEHVKDGQIVLNIGSEATHQLLIGNEDVTFQARFNGRAFPIYVPVDCVAAIYARENGQGMAFEVELQETATATTPAGEAPVLVEAAVKPEVPETKADAADETGGEPTEPKPRSHLTRIK